MDKNLVRKMVFIIALVMLIFTAGTVGYYLIEKPHQNMTIFDAFYLTVITLTTIGFGEIPGRLSINGRILTICLALSGMGTLLYSISQVTSFFIEGHLKNLLFKRRMSKMVEKLTNHFIVCGSGLKTRYICEEMMRTNNDYVVVDSNEESLEALSEELEGVKFVVGDVSDDDVIIKCGVMKAKGVLTTQDTDQENLFTIITARRLNPDLRIITLAHQEKSIAKLKYAGADGVISSNFIGSLRMVSEMIRPAAVNFLDEMLKDKSRNWRIEQAVISEKSSLLGKSLKEAPLSDKGKLLILAIVNENGEYNFIPAADTQFSQGATIICLGPNPAIKNIKKLAAG